MSEIEDIAGTKFDKLLQQVHFGEFDVVNSRMNERLDMSAESEYWSVNVNIIRTKRLLC